MDCMILKLLLTKNGNHGREQSIRIISVHQRYLVANLKITSMNDHLSHPSNSLPILSNEPNKLIGDWIKDEQEYAIALTYSEKKIGDYNVHDMKKLVEIMAQWRILLGVTSESTEQELVVICQFIYDNFKRFTLSDIKMAMNWSIAGKLDVGFVSQKNISSYYVSRALNSYEDVKRSIYNRIVEEKHKHLQRLEDIESKSKKFTPEEKANEFKELILSMYNSHINGKEFYDLGDMVYQWLKDTKLLDMDKKIIDTAIKYGIEKYMEERSSNSFRRNIINTLQPDEVERKKKKYARQYMIMHYFNTVTTISEIINAIKPSQFND